MIIERVITVEYLEPSMSRELLRKFPDNSAFDFDYSQSGIWSPLLPRNSSHHTSPISESLNQLRRNLLHEPEEIPHDMVSVSPMEIRRKIFDGLEDMSQNKRKKCCTVNSSAFGFDNSQSGIWSPLLPRGQTRMVSGFPMVIRRKILDGLENVPQNKLSKVTAKLKKKMITSMSRKEGVDVSASPDKISKPKKGWGKALKAASRQFKKHKEPSLQIKLPNFLKIRDF